MGNAEVTPLSPEPRTPSAAASECALVLSAFDCRAAAPTDAIGKESWVFQNLDLDTLRTLVVAHDLGGYSQAAKRLGRSPSAIRVWPTFVSVDTVDKSSGLNAGDDAGFSLGSVRGARLRA